MLIKPQKPIGGDTKRLSWVLTLPTAVLCTLASIPYTYSVVWHWDEAANFTTDPLSRFIVTYFLVFLVLDVIFGILHYKDQFDFLAGWFHHGCYLAFFGWCRYMNFSIGQSRPLFN
mmetsp:Transcript_49929/g.85462  ORF Transcript_49929/g.85462 Transcript_49929/m.85462 type:complete len:116 (-) Transcript_49929:556-903(-)